MMPQNTIVLDLETARSADDCRHCGHQKSAHYDAGACADWDGQKPPRSVTQFSPIGWNNKSALGLAIGAYYDYEDQRIHWFDVHTLEATIDLFIERQPLMVTFNGIGFDFVLMRGLLRREAEQQGGCPTGIDRQNHLVWLCDTFKVQCAASYDILAEIWKVDPARKFERGLNSLDAIARANGLGGKLGHGALAPRDWAAGRYADVLNYCQDDVYKTKALFEGILEHGNLLRGDGIAISLPCPYAPQKGQTT